MIDVAAGWHLHQAGTRYVLTSTSGSASGGWSAGDINPYDGSDVALYRRSAGPAPHTADPLLVLDTNGDGAINNGHELTGLSDTTAALNLLRMDSNGDKVLNSADLIFSKLEIWGDRNLDGHSQAYERRSLGEAGMVAVDLDTAQFTAIHQPSANANTYHPLPSRIQCA